MIPRIVDARHAGNYRVWLRFDDGLTGETDLADQLWGLVFEPLQDIGTFAKVRLESATDTISWACGADFSPTWLHERLRTAQGQGVAAK